MVSTHADKTKQLRKDVAPFAKSETRLSIQQILNTLVPLVLIWGQVMYCYSTHLGLRRYVVS